MFGNQMSDPSWPFLLQICHWYHRNLDLKYLREFKKKYEMTLMLFSGTLGGEEDSLKKPDAKNLVTLSL